MKLSASSAVVLLALASLSLPASAAQSTKPASSAQARGGRADVRLFELASVRRLFHTLARRGDAMTEGEHAAALADFSVMTEAVVGGAPGGPFTFDELTRAAAGVDGGRVSTTSGVAGRDQAAYQLLALGYSARETADVVSGRISRQALDTAQRMIAVGGRVMPRPTISQYRLVLVARRPERKPSGQRRHASSAAFDAAIERYARPFIGSRPRSYARSCRPNRRSTRTPARTPAPSA